MRIPRHAVLLAAAIAALAAPAAADARGSITYDGTTMTFTGDDATDAVNVGVSLGEMAWNTSGIDGLPAECTRVEYVDTMAYCPFPQRIVVRLGGGDDRFSVTNPSGHNAFPSNVVIESFGEDGNDWLQSGASQDGGAGNDKLEGHDGDQALRGGPGNDIVHGLAGNDQVFGDEGDDNVSGDGYKAPGRDVIDGGPGEDLLDNDWTESQKPSLPITLTQNGAADDGRAGEGDNVAGIERFKVYSGGTFVGTEGPDTFEIEPAEGREAGTVSGLGGNDRLVGDDGDETIDGGAGDDFVEGGFMNDTLVGGPGKDTIFGDETGAFCNYATYCLTPAGNDTIDSRDGEVDTVDCGVGTDVVKADKVDVLSGCETVELAPEPAPVAAGPAAPAPGARALRVTVARGKLAAALRRGLSVRVAVPGAGSITATAVRGRRTVGRGTARATSAGTKTVRVHFSRAARRALRRSRVARLTVAVAFTPKQGTPSRGTSAVTLRR